MKRTKRTYPLYPSTPATVFLIAEKLLNDYEIFRLSVFIN